MFGFNYMLGIYWMAEKLLASQGLFSMEQVLLNKQQTNSVALAHKQCVLTERPVLVDVVSANFN
jgi:hypothetical protein